MTRHSKNVVTSDRPSVLTNICYQLSVLVLVHPRQPACSSFSHNVKSICLATWKWKWKLPGLTPHIQSQFEAYPVLASSPDHWPWDEDSPVSKKQLYSDGPPILTLHVPFWVSASPPDGVMMMPDAVIWLFREELWTSTPGWVFGGINVPEVVILPLGTWKGDCERLGGQAHILAAHIPLIVAIKEY